MNDPRRVLGFGLLLLFAGCSLEPTYQRPDPAINQQWPTNAGAQCCAAQQAFDQDWHRFIVDDRLRQLIDMALNGNRSLAQVAASVSESRAGLSAAQASLYPSLGVNSYTGRSKTPPLVRTPGGGESSGSIENTFQTTVGLTSFELDLFGRLRSLRNAAGAQFESTLADYQTARLSLIGEVSSTWLSLQSSQDLLNLAQTTYDQQKRYSTMLAASFNAGATARLDLHQADAITHTAAVQVNTYRMQVAQDTNALQVLIGQAIPAKLLPTGATGVAAVTGDVPAGLPSTLLQRRPDIVSAEALVRAANAGIGSARAAFFPTFSLTGLFGGLSGDFSNSLSRPQQYFATALTGSFTLVDAGTRRAQTDAAHARYDEQAAAYQATVQNAFREAADALNARQEMRDQIKFQQLLVEDYRQAYRQSLLLFESGMDSYFSTMDAQRSLFDAQQALITMELAREVNQVTLYKVLGGGWSPQAQLVSK